MRSPYEPPKAEVEDLGQSNPAKGMVRIKVWYGCGAVVLGLTSIYELRKLGQVGHVGVALVLIGAVALGVLSVRNLKKPSHSRSTKSVGILELMMLVCAFAALAILDHYSFRILEQYFGLGAATYMTIVAVAAAVLERSHHVRLYYDIGRVVALQKDRKVEV